MKLELFMPVAPWAITQLFGNDPQSYAWLGIKGHNGIDIKTSRGQIVRAAHDGTVTFAGEDSSGGWGVVIRTDEPREYQDGECYFKTIYWHLVPVIPVKAGQKVKVGDVIGYADNTGFTTGDHLHLGLKPVAKGEQDWQWNNIEQDNGFKGAIDPFPYISRYTAQDFRGFLVLFDELKRQVDLIRANYVV